MNDTITLPREAAQQVLAVLQTFQPYSGPATGEAIGVLHKALAGAQEAQPERNAQLLEAERALLAIHTKIDAAITKATGG